MSQNMRRKKKYTITNCDEYSQLHALLNQLKEVWDNYERYLNSLEDEELIEYWSYKVLLQKQMYRYILRQIKEKYQGGYYAKDRYDCSGNSNIDTTW